MKSLSLPILRFLLLVVVVVVIIILANKSYSSSEHNRFASWLQHHAKTLPAQTDALLYFPHVWRMTRPEVLHSPWGAMSAACHVPLPISVGFLESHGESCHCEKAWIRGNLENAWLYEMLFINPNKSSGLLNLQQHRQQLYVHETFACLWCDDGNTAGMCNRCLYLWIPVSSR